MLTVLPTKLSCLRALGPRSGSRSKLSCLRELRPWRCYTRHGPPSSVYTKNRARILFSLHGSDLNRAAADALADMDTLSLRLSHRRPCLWAAQALLSCPPAFALPVLCVLPCALHFGCLGTPVPCLGPARVPCLWAARVGCLCPA